MATFCGSRSQSGPYTLSKSFTAYCTDADEKKYCCFKRSSLP